MRKSAHQPSSKRYGSAKKRRVLEAYSLEHLLAKSSDQLHCSLVPEPELVFGGKQCCVDPKTGLAAYGPYSKTDATKRDQLRIGIVGPAEAIDRALALLSTISQPIEQKDTLDAILHPSFPGVNSGEPFQIELVTQSLWHRPLRPLDVRLVEEHDDFMIRVGLLKRFVSEEVRALSELDSPPDVVICAMSESLEELCRTGIAEYDKEHEGLEDLPGHDVEEPSLDTARSFRRGLKAECMDVLPTQLVWHRTLAGTRGVQDLATRAWNMSVALLYKGKVIPWRLADAMEGSCFVGISFYHEDESRSPFVRTSIAQAFTERGEGFVLRGDALEWDPRKEKDKAPHLNEEQAQKLLSRVLEVYEKQVGAQPRKVVVHKTSRYADLERRGFETAIGKIGHYGLTTISRRGIFCLRPGDKAVLRGTSIHFGDKLGLVYTTGYTPFLRCYSGFRIPQPLEITENWGNLPFHETAADLIRLTKLNWNTAAFCTHDPITLAFSRRVGDILKMAGQKEPAIQYRFYM
jgi:hypothetical protein